MIIGIGTDIIEVARIQKLIEQHEERAYQKIFTETEVEYCNSFGKRRYEHFAARFAVKEAFSKAIGTGLTNSFAFRDVGVENLESGQPVLSLRGVMAERWAKYKIQLSISHIAEYAMAFVVISDNNG